MNLKLHKPSEILSAKIYLPGSKSISNRVLIINALSGLPFLIQNLSDSDDTTHLKDALDNYSNSSIINVGHAGTDMRFLTAFLSLKTGTYELTGSERLQQRPIKDLVDVLQKLGADINYKNKEGYPPLLIKGKQLDGGKVEINGNVSSQFITALLLVAPYFKNGLELTIKNELVSTPYVHMTVELMKEFGASVNWTENVITVKPISYAYTQNEYTVESDWSAASYYYSILALSKINTKLTISGLFKNSLQADAVCNSIYNQFGVNTEFLKNEIVVTKFKDVNSKEIVEYDFIQCPDIAQTFACTCIGLKYPFSFTGLQTLKVKETDRIIALQKEIKKFGYAIEVTENSMKLIDFKSTLIPQAISVSTYNDHRMAMSFAALSLVYDAIIIEDALVVSKSYPLFWEHLKQIGIKQTQEK